MVELSSQELLNTAFELFTQDIAKPKMALRYSGRFKEYNATVSMTSRGRKLEAVTFSLSRAFLDCEDDIVIGVLQHLLNKVFKTNKESTQQELYHGFMKHVNRYAKRTPSEPLLIELFHELNTQYFEGLMDMPNLVFGKHTLTTLGHYTFSTDTVTLSTALQENNELLKYVLYHELLHKKHSFTRSQSGQTQYHTPAFRRDEKKYKVKNIEHQLERFIKKKKITTTKSLFSFWK
ncbi:MAG: SprT-like domain-containing protein [Candidatus Woesearchaeota archaeon]